MPTTGVRHLLFPGALQLESPIPHPNPDFRENVQVQPDSLRIQIVTSETKWLNGVPTIQWLGSSSFAMVEEPRRSELFWPKNCNHAYPYTWYISYYGSASCPTSVELQPWCHPRMRSCSTAPLGSVLYIWRTIQTHSIHSTDKLPIFFNRRRRREESSLAGSFFLPGRILR